MGVRAERAEKMIHRLKPKIITSHILFQVINGEFFSIIFSFKFSIYTISFPIKRKPTKKR
jgi:hypothetical protein